MDYNCTEQTPVRPTLAAEKSTRFEDMHSVRKTAGKYSSNRHHCQSSPDEDRRISQREKQISYGFVTEGYRNMIKLVLHDPLLKTGGILPLSPPDVNKGSKRTWDVSLRKWRRALHMFDNVFIEGEDESSNTLESVIEEQRLQWVSPLFLQQAKEERVRLTAEKIKEARNSPYVPKKLPVEESLKIILRSEDCYEPVNNVVPPSASSLIRGSDISPLDAGIKIYLAPSTHNQQNSTSERLEVLPCQETMRTLCINSFTPVHIGSSPTNMNVSPPSTMSRMIHPGYATPVFNGPPPPPLHYDSSLISSIGFHPKQTNVQTGSALRQPVQEWNSLCPPPTCAPQELHAPVLNSGLNRVLTPATAPRRITLLRSSQGERKLGDTENLQRNLFPNSSPPFYRVNTKNNMTSPGIWEESPTGTTTTSFKDVNENENPGMDPVSQKLFS